MTSLFTPLAFARGPAMKNRLMLAPLTNQQSHPGGLLSDEEIDWLTRRAGGQAGFEQCTGLRADLAGLGEGVLAHDLLLGRQQVVAQRTLERGDTAAFEQRRVVLDARHQALLRRHGEDHATVHAERLRHRVHLATDLEVDLRIVAQPVPQTVDLVEHDEATALARAAALHVVAPDRQIALGHAGIGGEDEQHRVGVGQHRQRELGLGADGVEARRVEHHQPLLEQRMGELDHRMAPARNLDQPVGARLDALLARQIDRKAEHLRVLGGDALGLAHARKRTLQAGRIDRGQRIDRPFLAVALELAHRRLPCAGADRQQAQLGGRPLAPLQLGRTHGGTPGARGQDAVAMVAEEDRVDEFGLAARELGDEGHGELVVVQALEQILQAQVALRVAHVIAREPGTQARHRLARIAAPAAVSRELFGQVGHRFAHRTGCLAEEPAKGQIGSRTPSHAGA